MLVPRVRWHEEDGRVVVTAVRLAAPLRDTLRTWAQRCSAGHQLDVLERS